MQSERSGHWEYGAIVSDPGEPIEIDSNISGDPWFWQGCFDLNEAGEHWGDREIVRRWVPAPEEWEKLP